MGNERMNNSSNKIKNEIMENRMIAPMPHDIMFSDIRFNHSEKENPRVSFFVTISFHG